MKLIIATFFLAGICSANSTYTYMGSPMANLCSFDPVCQGHIQPLELDTLQATLTFSAPVADSATLSLGPTDPALIYWSISDLNGVFALNSTNASHYDSFIFTATIMTDSSGNIENTSTMHGQANDHWFPCTVYCTASIGSLADDFAYYMPCNSCIFFSNAPGQWTTLPEPSTFALLSLGVLCAGILRRWRSRGLGVLILCGGVADQR